MLQELDQKGIFIVVGRANSGTRMLPEALQASGVYFGEPLNIASDLLPVDDIYAAVRMMGPYVDRVGTHAWDFKRVLEAEIPTEFVSHLERYLNPLIESPSELIGWKIPENNLIFPWLVRLMPNARFMHWVRHPETNCKKMMGIDRLTKWNIPAKKYLIHDGNHRMRASSWKYHFDIVEDTPRPANFIRVRFEDFLSQDPATIKAIDAFTGLTVRHPKLNPKKMEPLGRRYRQRFKFLEASMAEMGYE